MGFVGKGLAPQPRAGELFRWAATHNPKLQLQWRISKPERMYKMKHWLNITSGLICLILLGLLVVTLPPLMKERERTLAAQVPQSPLATPTPLGPLVTPTVAPTPISPCTFAPRPAPAKPVTPLEAYQFSEPQVVLTHTSAIGIAGWLPNGQQLLITRLIPDQPREVIEVFNTRTGELQRYGERHSLPGKPVWLAAYQAVAFADVGPDQQVVLRISRGEAVSIETPVSGLATSSLTASPDGSRVVFFTQAAPDRAEALDVALAQRQIFPALSLTPWQDLSALGQQYGPEPYQATWSPSGNQIAFYNDTGFYLVDLPSGRICEVDLGFERGETGYGKRWAFYVQWSPNGRYIGALTSVGDHPVSFVDLTLIDTSTGERRALSPGPDIEYVYDFTWAPDSHQLIALAQVEIIQGRPIQKLYLMDVQTGVSQSVVPHNVFGGGAIEGWQLAWSPDGQTLAVKCPTWLETGPTIVEDHICTISVARKP
jgi:Tol biopolymer transport system component